MHKTDSLKDGDVVYCLEKGVIREWKILMTNPKNGRYYIVIDNKEHESSIKQVSWKSLEYFCSYYPSDMVWGITKEDVVERLKIANQYIYDNIMETKNGQE